MCRRARWPRERVQSDAGTLPRGSGTRTASARGTRSCAESWGSSLGKRCQRRRKVQKWGSRGCLGRDAEHRSHWHCLFAAPPRAGVGATASCGPAVCCAGAGSVSQARLIQRVFYAPPAGTPAMWVIAARTGAGASAYSACNGVTRALPARHHRCVSRAISSLRCNTAGASNRSALTRSTQHISVAPQKQPMAEPSPD